MGEQADEERAKQIFEKCNKIEEQFGELFTGKKTSFSCLRAFETKIIGFSFSHR